VSLDYPIRPRQHVRRNREADLFRRFQIDDQLELMPFGVTRQNIYGPARKLGVDGMQRRHDRAFRVRLTS
jgi:hypothetical protein